MQHLTGNPYIDGTNVFHGAGVLCVRRADAQRPSQLAVAAADGTGLARLNGGKGAVLTVAADAGYLRIENMSALHTLPRLGALRQLGELVLCDLPLMVVPDLSDCGALWRIRLEQVPMESVVANIGSPPALRVLELFMCEAMRSIEAGFVDRAQTLRALTVRCRHMLRELCVCSLCDLHESMQLYARKICDTSGGRPRPPCVSGLLRSAGIRPDSNPLHCRR